jgi:hypothetical protein
MARGGNASHLPLRQTRDAPAKFQIFLETPDFSALNLNPGGAHPLTSP